MQAQEEKGTPLGIGEAARGEGVETPQRKHTHRDRTRRVWVGTVPVGGGAPISVQSMTKTSTLDVAGTVDQINRLATSGCEIVRVAVPDVDSARALGVIISRVSVPVVADVHFDYRVALAAIDAGAHKIRINPGNIGGRERVKAVVQAAMGRNIPIRVGVNAGSLEERLVKKFPGRPAAALVTSARDNIRLLEDLGFRDIVISVKASDVVTTVEAYELIAGESEYPLHVGVTEAGTVWAGTVRSALGLGIILSKGIGDTLRISLTGDPLHEIRAGWEVLKALGLRRRGATVVSCPTCGRCEVDLTSIASLVEEGVADIDEPLRIAVMGCAVNGPGEASEADVGLAAGKAGALLFRQGKLVRKVRVSEMVESLVREAHVVAAEKGEAAEGAESGGG
ncbi:MAG: flavodoxin-dependent (E)-4-hydroxy-3-methylbut-2-enyl-diphosphate synthase [Firmicutes bacterium]|nr:flavodoxin-dependent (E)-4-hydroxy-3-methylbut-2-enyl-diphosphate synthase [Bacillota bacterium]